ncbi:hypothetical protein CHUAL_001457 [Chamberlinius hualienensis]
MSSSTSSSPTSVAELTLYVKAGSDGVRYGACPICQRVFMLLSLRLRYQQLSFKVATINLAKPPEDFRKLGLKRLPALHYAANELALDNVDEIIDFLDENFPLNNNNDDVNGEVDVEFNVFSKFCFFIKDVCKDPVHLMGELTKLDKQLRETSGRRFLLADELSEPDCQLLPKLQHIRVASGHLKGFELPTQLTALWKYLYHAYSEPIFVQSCPSDQEIVIYWADKAETPKLSFERHAHLTNEIPKYSFDVPAKATLIDIQ